MQDANKNRKGKGKAILAIFLVLLLLAGAGAGFFLLGGPELFAKAPTPFILQGEVRAMELTPLASETATEKEWREYFAGALAFAAENDINTVIFQGKSQLPVYWRDANFPVPLSVSAQDSFFNKLDPLALLCKEAGAKDIQVWLSVDPYTSGGYSSEMKGKAVKLAVEEGGASHTYFSPANEAYTKLFLHSIERLPKHYPLAGVVLSGLEVPTQELASLPNYQNSFAALAQGISQKWAEKGYKTSLSLSFQDGETTLVGETVASSLSSSGIVQYLLPTLPAHASVSARLTAWGTIGKIIPVQQEGQNAVVLFTAAKMASYSGAVLGIYPSIQTMESQIGLLRSALTPAEGTLPIGFVIPQQLSINYPKDGAKIFTDGLFILGNSDPTQPLFLNGAEVPNRAPGGSFGVAVALGTGPNSFTFTQGQTTQTITVNKPAPSGGGGGGGALPHDSSIELEPGTAVKVVGVFASALTDPAKDSSINETFYSGAVAVVQNSIETTRYNSAKGRSEITFVYQLTSGDYILSRQCQPLTTPGNAAFTGITAESDNKGEYLYFQGSGSPAAYLSMEGDRLKVTMYDTTFQLPPSFTSKLVRSATVENIPGGVELILQAPDVWGYSIEYIDGQTRLFLKSKPVLNDDPLRPLAGVRIMLDPGHGGDDMGAPGLMGENHGPNEKDLNLALAQTIAYRLRQLGADVIMMRNDDVYIGTMERLAMQITEKPDFFLSVHHNSVNLDKDRNDVYGVESYFFVPGSYPAPASKTFAQNLLDSISPATGRRASEAGWGYYNVIRTTGSPSVLFEFGYVVNPAEFEDVASTDGMHASACATADAILKMLGGE